ncbi:LysR family transcriptional regulator [Kribbella sandramycini]|uniref:DNA-binding transcriptional LysR family regulator n=1 Tax=Kribbella sandramycini TaxID=60450 RepID=A0A7Y4L109_9ACTN|nr:LysR family transcriptional regulator [Kribbella sandramycini]MBB6565054.1 DNA-binding transcriptional LysR family regulator [Kribbella sandramycini]NOL41326.1 LysR family transcriptional regulator [Kribbella sandramycini]
MTTLRQLEYLVTVVDTGSFTKAAELLHVTQPALSHQIRALERSAGGPLLERLPRNIRLTSTGRAMLPHARAALADAQRAACAARQAAGLEVGELQIATLYSITLGILPAALRRWRRHHPDVGIRLYEHRHTDELVEAMNAGEADLAIGPEPADWTGVVHPLGSEEFVVVVAADDPAASGETISLQALADRAWVHYAPTHGLAAVLDRACAQAGFEPFVAVRTEQTAAAPALATAGLGPALVPDNILPASFDGRILRLDPPVRRQLTAYTRGEPDPLAAAFIASLS